MGMCKECGKVVGTQDMKDGYCKDCYRTNDNNMIKEIEVNNTNDKNEGLPQIFGFIGSIMLIVGVFTPLISIPMMGSMNYFQNGKGDGTIVLVLGVISIIIVLIRQYKWLWLTGLGSLGLLAYTFIQFQSRMSDVKSEMETSLAGNPFRGLADMAMQSVQIQWGFALLALGSIFLIVSASIKR